MTDITREQKLRSSIPPYFVLFPTSNFSDKPSCRLACAGWFKYEQDKTSM